MSQKEEDLKRNIEVLSAIREAFKPKKSAADIEALRWREMFQAALGGITANNMYDPPDAKKFILAASKLADLGLEQFYARYEREK